MRRLPPQLTPGKRAAAALLVLFLLVAQNWHICELGGHASHHAHQKPVAKLNQKPARAWQPKCGGGPQCACTPPATEAAPTATQLLSATNDNHSHDTCLARLLLGMPGSLSAPIEFVSLLAQRTAFAPSLFQSPVVAMLPQPPSRGPPLFSA